ncbi:MAG: phospholipase D family protein [Elusimicrobia bacterium]|nr:phospholipase D family protein [Elusimicrobiota bacterium]
MARQESLFPDPDFLKTAVIGRRKDFDALFEGFTRLRAISYVVSPDLLLELFSRGFSDVEVLVGENLSESYRQILGERGPEAAERLAERVADGALRILVPERTVHTKLYILEREGLRRVIQTSANLTETARRASRQVNYAWFADLEPGHPWLGRVEEDYQAHLRHSALFMGDLADLIKQNRPEERRKLVEAWLKGVAAEEVETETRKLLQEIAAKAVEKAAGQDEPLFSVRLPDAPAARRQAERILSAFGPACEGAEFRLAPSRYLRYVTETHGVPVLRADPARRELRLGFGGEVESLAEPLPEPASVSGALAHLEAYFSTVELGKSPDPDFAKTSLFEALLYFMAAPFAHEFMKLKRSRYGAIDSRGPRFLYIYGPSQNGKSTFLKFVLKLLTGRAIEPLSGGDFAKRKVQGVASVGTSFPLAFDDVVMATRAALFEEVLKSYWESWWREDCVAPQIVLSSNAYTLPPWAKSRVKRLDFDVHFAPTDAGRDALAGLFRGENRLFRWFAPLYMSRMASGSVPGEDELAWAREVFAELYRHAGRAVPGYFPEGPIEKLYDPGLKAWRDMIDRLGKAKVRWETDRAVVEFSADLQGYEVREYESHLPAQIKHRRRGNTILIESPAEFKAWLSGGKGRGSGGWLARLLGRRPAP